MFSLIWYLMWSFLGIGVLVVIQIIVEWWKSYHE